MLHLSQFVLRSFDLNKIHCNDTQIYSQISLVLNRCISSSSKTETKKIVNKCDITPRLKKNHHALDDHECITRLGFGEFSSLSFVIYPLEANKGCL